MAKAGTNAGMVQERTRLVIQAVILAPSLAILHLQWRWLHLDLLLSGIQALVLGCISIWTFHNRYSTEWSLLHAERSTRFGT